MPFNPIDLLRRPLSQSVPSSVMTNPLPEIPVPRTQAPITPSPKTGLSQALMAMFTNPQFLSAIATIVAAKKGGKYGGYVGKGITEQSERQYEMERQRRIEAARAAKEVEELRLKGEEVEIKKQEVKISGLELLQKMGDKQRETMKDVLDYMSKNPRASPAAAFQYYNIKPSIEQLKAAERLSSELKSGKISIEQILPKEAIGTGVEGTLLDPEEAAKIYLDYTKDQESKKQTKLSTILEYYKEAGPKYAEALAKQFDIQIPGELPPLEPSGSDEQKAIARHLRLNELNRKEMTSALSQEEITEKGRLEESQKYFKELRTSGESAIADRLERSIRATRLSQIVNDYDGNPTVRQFQTSASGMAFILGTDITKDNPVGDYALIIAFGKVTQPDAFMKGEMELFQDAAATLQEQLGIDVKRLLSIQQGTLDKNIRTRIKTTAAEMYKGRKEYYEGIRNQYVNNLSSIIYDPSRNTLESSKAEAEKTLIDYRIKEKPKSSTSLGPNDIIIETQYYDASGKRINKR